MILNRILKIILILLSICYIALLAFGNQIEGDGVSAVVLTLLTILYYRGYEKKRHFFMMFLITFTFAHILNYIAHYLPEYEHLNYQYYSVNLLYILSYVFLILRVATTFDFRVIFRKFPIHILILVVLDILCVSIITATAESKLSTTEYLLEFSYNTVIMALLSFALVNYLFRNDNKSMLFLVASIFIVFSEIIQLAYYYIVNYDSNNLSAIYSTFLVMAFLFYYLQSQIENLESVDYGDSTLEI